MISIESKFSEATETKKQRRKRRKRSSAGMKSSAATSVMVARARGYLTPFGVDLRDAVTSAFAGVGRQRLAVALFAGRAFTHVQQARLEISNGADLRMTLGERGRFEDAAFTNGPNADVPLSLAQRLVRRGGSDRLLASDSSRRRGRSGRAAGQLVGMVLLEATLTQAIGRTGRRRRWRRSLLLATTRAAAGAGAGAAARLWSAHLPRGAKLFDAGGQLTGAHAQIVAPPAVKVAAQAAQSPLERRRHRHFQEALAVPQQFHSEIRSNDDAVTFLDDGQHAQANEGQRHPFVVHFDFHVLAQSHFQVFNGERDRLGPGKGTRRTRVVGDPDGESVVAAVGRQQVFACALEVEDPAVKRAVMRVSKHGAHGVVFHAFRTALARFFDWMAARWTRLASVGCLQR